MTQTDELTRLAVKLQAKFDREEARVFAYLSKHPEKLRSFEKNGLTYYLARLDAEGNPVFITARGASSPSSRPVDRLIKASPPSGEGSR